MNVERMQKLADHLATIDANEFDMESVLTCISGHALKLFGRPEDFWQLRFPETQVVLGIDQRQAVALCNPSSDPYNDREKFFSSTNAAKAVCLMIAGDNAPWQTLADREGVEL